MTTTCKACGKPNVRKSTLAVVVARGAYSGGRVCSECAAGGLLLVAKQGLIKEAAPRVIRSGAIDGAIRKLKTFAKVAEAAAGGDERVLAPDGHDASTLYHQQGRAEGLEVAVELLQRIQKGLEV